MFEKHIPTSSKLKKYIDGIYFVNNFNEKRSFFAFPFLGNVFCLFQNTSIDFNDYCINFKPSNEDVKIVLFGKYTHPIYVQYNNYVSEVFINFKLGGINHFFEKNISELAPKTFQFIEDNEFKKLTQKLFEYDNTNSKISLIENFLLDRLNNKKLSNIENCIELILKDPNIKITHIANQFNVSEKTINRWFKNYTGFSPSEIKRIVRFRNAIQSRNTNYSKNLTNICYENNFYDSSYFNKEFKKMTSLSPKDFFKKIDTKLLSEHSLPFNFND